MERRKNNSVALYHATRFDLNPESTALLVVDMRAGDMVKDSDNEYG